VELRAIKLALRAQRSYETSDKPTGAIAREKQIKARSRKKKIQLINSMNPIWRDLYETL
jgi:putative endonuclease